MAHRIKAKISKQTILISVVLLLFLAAQTAQLAHCQNTTTNNQWALSLSVLNSQNTPSTVFAPFDPIQLSSAVTYANASVANQLVTFKVQGPMSSLNPMNITVIAKTNTSGVANTSFTLPLETKDAGSVIGTWQATATIQTTNGTLQKSTNFTLRWNLIIASISLQNQQGQNQTIFNQNSIMNISLEITNVGQPETANITLNMADASNTIINQTQINNVQTTTNSTTPTQIQANLQIPKDAYVGDATIIASIYSGTYQNTSIPAGENQTAAFILASNGSNSNSTSPSTPTPDPTPTQTPNITENTVSLFAWLLVAVGLFTFTGLCVFLKRKPQPKPETQTIPITQPNVAPVTAPPTTPPPRPAPTIIATAPATTTQTSPMPTMIAAIAPEKTMSATTATQTQITPIQIEATPTEISESSNKPEVSSDIDPENLLGMQTEIDKIANTKKRIDPIQLALKLEKEQLDQDVQKLNETMDEREEALNNYIAALRQQVEKANEILSNNGNLTQEQLFKNDSKAIHDSKLDLGKTLPREPTLQPVLSQMSKVSSTSKRVQELKTTLESEKERLDIDVQEVTQTVENREMALIDYFDKVKEQIRQLKNDLTEQENQ